MNDSYKLISERLQIQTYIYPGTSSFVAALRCKQKAEDFNLMYNTCTKILDYLAQLIDWIG